MINIIILFVIFNLTLFLYYKNIIISFNIYDKPDFRRKIHKKKTSLVGGFFIYLNLLFLLIVFLLSKITESSLLKLYGNYNNFYLFILISSLFFFLGYLDDKLNLNATARASFGIYNNKSDVDNFIEAVKELKKFFKM